MYWKRFQTTSVRGWHGRRQQQWETTPFVGMMMRRLISSKQLTCREQKQSSDRGWKGEEVLMSVEGAVVR
jgi:hypothetical protein